MALAGGVISDSNIGFNMNGNVAAHQTNLVLQYDPTQLPMVCGLCSSQFATAKDLEDHILIHHSANSVSGETPIITVSSEQSTVHIQECTATQHIADQPTSQQAGVKRKYDVVSIGGTPEKQVRSSSAQKTFKLTELKPEGLPQTTSEGLSIARLDELSTYTEPNTCINPQTQIITEPTNPGLNNLSSEEFTITISADNQTNNEDTAASVILDKTTQPGSELVLTSNNNHTIPSVTNTQNTVSVQQDDEQVTHIEVCLQGFTDQFFNPAADSDIRVCELCQKHISEEETRTHLLEHTVVMDDLSTKYLCPRTDCETLHDNIPELRMHMSTQHKYDMIHVNSLLQGVNKSGNTSLSSHNEEQYGCEICGQMFKSKRAQGSHMKKHTKIYNPVNCEKCGKMFKHPSALKFHQSMNSECDKPKYQCSICGYKAATPWRLQSHTSQAHSEERPYTCQYCQKSYKTKEMLKLHTYKIHTGTRSLKCDQCSKMFFYPAELREHMQQHSDTKDYLCTLCNMSFKTMHTYRGHMNGKHSKIWFTCGFCQFTTAHRKSMKRHMVLVHKLKDVTLEVRPDDSDTNVPITQLPGIQSNLYSNSIEIVESRTDENILQYVTEDGQVLEHVQGYDMEGVRLQPPAAGSEQVLIIDQPHNGETVAVLEQTDGSHVLMI